MDDKSKAFVKGILPPFLLQFAQRFREDANSRAPEWCTVTSGILAGFDIFVNPEKPAFGAMIVGTYDDAFWKYLQDETLAGSTIYDVGGHIGYDTMAFAKLVGAQGQVVVFEPNPSNIERLRKNVAHNREVADRIEIAPVAVADFDGQTAFHSSAYVEDESSAAGYVAGSHRPRKPDYYERANFQKQIVPVVKLDTFWNESNDTDLSLIKVDVEGAEHQVLAGAMQILEACRPLLLIEIHTAVTMLKVCKILFPLHYSIEVLEEDEYRPGRCLVVARHNA